jgi:hypothetical protein
VEGLEDRSLPSTTPLNVAQAIVHSVENDTNFVTQQYHIFLNRTPSASEVSGWVNQMQNGLTNEQVEASFASSGEFESTHGIEANWVNSLYQIFLNRNGSTQEIDAWLAVMGRRETTYQVAFSIATSTEREAIVINFDYQHFLNRAPEPGAVSMWENNLQHGLDQAGLEADIVGSQEFFALAGGTDQGFVTRAYQTVLNRTPSQAEVNFWTSMLEAR